MTTSESDQTDPGCCAPPETRARPADDELRLFPTPARITAALDMAGLFGPEADATLGVTEPTVDMWESGLLGMTRAQVDELAARAGVPPEWLFKTEPLERFTGWVCLRRKVDGARCHRTGTPDPAPIEKGTLF